LDETTYLFAITLIPASTSSLPILPQHYTFLVDRSNSMQKEGLTTVKQAIQKALTTISSQDTFNVIAFDSSSEKLFPTGQLASQETLDKASQFLSRLSLGSFFNATNLYTPLLLSLPPQDTANRLYNTILVSNGEAPHRELLATWTLQNQGHTTFFSLITGRPQSVPFFESLALVNRGISLHATNKHGVKRKLLKLLKQMKSPIAHNIHCHAIAQPNQHLALHFDPQTTPHLYVSQPFVLFGSTKSLEDFTLFIQGKGLSEWINIRKTISFSYAKKGGKQLITMWEKQGRSNLKNLAIQER
jgi:Ca-activated chloride channel family protein